MLSKILEIQNEKIKMETEEGEERTPPSFDKEKEEEKSSPFPLSTRIKEQTLSALKELLSKQKEEIPVSAAGPFQDIPSFREIMISEAAASPLNIDPPSAQVMQLFHKLAEALTYTHIEGIQETTLFLDEAAFSSSFFQGAKITITEYSTAPKVFNIHFTADARALSIFEAHAAELINAFKNGNFAFEVHRIDTSLLSEDEKHSLPRVERDLEKEEEKGE